MRAGASKLGADQQYDSTLEDAFECATLLEPPGASPLWAALLMSGSRRVRVMPTNSQKHWLIRKHVAFEIHLEDSEYGKTGIPTLRT